MKTLRALTPVDHKITHEVASLAKAQKEARNAMVSHIRLSGQVPTIRHWRTYLEFLDQGIEYWLPRVS